MSQSGLPQKKDMDIFREKKKMFHWLELFFFFGVLCVVLSDCLGKYLCLYNVFFK